MPNIPAGLVRGLEAMALPEDPVPEDWQLASPRPGVPFLFPVFPAPLTTWELARPHASMIESENAPADPLRSPCNR